MHRVVLPALAGVLSAQGMLASRPGRDLSLAVLAGVSGFTDEELIDRFSELERSASGQLCDEGVEENSIRYRRQLEMRYQGQSTGFVLEFQPGSNHAESFHKAHEAASGHRLDREVELVNLRLSARAPAPVTGLERMKPAKGTDQRKQAFMADLRKPVPVIDRRYLLPGEQLQGPAVITEMAATTWLAPGWTLEVDDWGNLILLRSEK